MTFTLAFIPSQTVRDEFNYDCGFFNYSGFRDQMIDSLVEAGFDARPEDSAPGEHRIWVEDIGGYYWPEDNTRERWVHAV